MGKSEREKGKAGEREVAALCREYGFDVRRGQQFKGTKDSPDVVGLIGHHVEVKRRNRWQIRQWYEQCAAEAAQDAIPVLFVREDRADWLVVLDAHDYLRLLEDLGIAGEEVDEY